MWEKLLGVRHVGAHDNYFELGGNSILAVRLFSQIEDAFNVRLPLCTLSRGPYPRTTCEGCPSSGPAPGVDSGGSNSIQRFAASFLLCSRRRWNGPHVPGTVPNTLGMTNRSMDCNPKVPTEDILY